MKATIQETKENAKEDLEGATKDIEISFGSEEKDLGKDQHFIKKHIWKIAALGIGASFVIFNQNTNIDIPNWVNVLIASFIIGIIVGYPYARRIARLLINDNRIPIVAIDPTNLNDIEVWRVPQKQIEEMRTIESLHEIQTSKGRGFAVEDIQMGYNEQGKKQLIAKGTWLGEKSGLEIMRHENEIEATKENVIPWAKIGFNYHTKWPMIIHDISGKITNNIMKMFQTNVNYKGEELYETIEKTVSEHKIENPAEVKDVSVEEIEEKDPTKMELLGNGGKEQ